MALHKRSDTKGNRYARNVDEGLFTGKELFLQHLHSLVSTFLTRPSLLQGKVRNIKIEPHYRESRSRVWGQSAIPKTTCKIRLTGNWIATAGFAENERIHVIPMKRMLIIIPEKTRKKYCLP